ncbi:hypothetical protein IE53DRAFT_631 [Violaceomyces palustris]|uniref:Uncharacterized protein n=1 Tax=Violaceomyces palustris TaxID=1673888 RepID=A0ACD0P8M6_9BASI|nr:hypothetical protein IE53DRAFT_631 [Violaceomyces palustris]
METSPPNPSFLLCHPPCIHIPDSPTYNAPLKPHLSLLTPLLQPGLDPSPSRLSLLHQPEALIS